MYSSKIKSIGLCLVLIISFSHIQAQPGNGEKIFAEQIAPLFKGMGDHNFEISSTNERVQTFFNQGIALTYGFNHLEAGRAYKQVAVLEPNLAIAYWGQALVLGPNINLGMSPDDVMPAYELIQKAVSLKKYASQKERDLIDALSKRYSKDINMDDRSLLDEAYADAMRKVSAKYPDDPNIRTLLASALMVLHPWDYWNADGTPKAWTPEILNVIETGLRQHPRHAGLIHYYIHAVEASKNAGRALEYADILGDLIPGSGHIVHMPSHIYIRTGQYHKGVLANEKAIEVDADYITQCRQQGIYPLAYVPHNRHFLWAMATLEGSSDKAIKAAEHMAMHIDEELMRAEGLTTLQHFWITPIYAYVRFGKWDKILSLEKPAEDLLYPTAIWHYARGVAFTAKGKIPEARKELDALAQISGDQGLRDINVWEINEAYDVVKIALHTLEGEMAAKEKKYGLAVQAFNKAIKIEDALNYNEPSDWHYPVRHSLGAVLIEAGHFAEAEKVYLEDLETFPENGWSLYGLYQSFIGQRKMKEASQLRERIRQAWQWADIELTSSRIL